MCKLMFGGGMLDRVCVFRDKDEKKNNLGFIGHVSQHQCALTTT
jgi:hypothetical protein